MRSHGWVRLNRSRHGHYLPMVWRGIDFVAYVSDLLVVASGVNSLQMTATLVPSGIKDGLHGSQHYGYQL